MSFRIYPSQLQKKSVLRSGIVSVLACLGIHHLFMGRSTRERDRTVHRARLLDYISKPERETVTQARTTVHLNTSSSRVSVSQVTISHDIAHARRLPSSPLSCRSVHHPVVAWSIASLHEPVHKADDRAGVDGAQALIQRVAAAAVAAFRSSCEAYSLAYLAILASPATGVIP